MNLQTQDTWELMPGETTAIPRWSPDGQWLVFARLSEDQSKSTLWMSRRDGTDAQILTDELWQILDLEWLP